MRAVRGGPERAALRLSYVGTQERCYVSAQGATRVLIQEWLKVVPLAAYSPVAGGRREEGHTRRPNGLDLLVV